MVAVVVVLLLLRVWSSSLVKVRAAAGRKANLWMGGREWLLFFLSLRLLIGILCDVRLVGGSGDGRAG